MRLLLALGLLEAALIGVMGWWPGAGVPIPGLGLFGAGFAVYLFAATRSGRTPRHLARHELRVIWGVGIAMRIALLPLAPELSDDVWRYLWDGHVQLQGINPYLFAPSDPALDPWATAVRELVNHPDVPTIYPPVAQVMFLLASVVGGTLLQLKLLWLGFDLATAWLLVRVAGASGRPVRPVLLLYLWSPLLVVETAWSGHLEPLGLFGIVWFLAMAGPDREHVPAGRRRRQARSQIGAGLGLAWAGLTKFAPLVALPALVNRLGFRFLLATLLACVGLYLPYAGAGGALFEGLGTYAEHWRFNEFGFVLIEAVAPEGLARPASLAVVLAVVAWTALRGYGPERTLFWILGAGFLVTPTLHPWYALWILPFAALRRSAPWLVFTGTAFIGYLGLGAYQETGVWPQPLWGRLLLWLPVLLLLARDALSPPRGVVFHRTGDAEP